MASGLFVERSGSVRLIGGRDKADGKVVFPLPQGGASDRFEAIELPGEGALWSFTVQRFRPKPPFDGDGTDADFVPYAVGYVQLGDVLIVEGRIVADDISALSIGMPMRTVTEVYRTDEQGHAVSTYAFTPVRGGGA